MEVIHLKDGYIKLGQALKIANLVESGAEAKYVVQEGLVRVNGEVDTRRGKKLEAGDMVEYNGETVKIEA
nr:RNA-binding S4 domain-containing protein [uncultured Acetatifactor sp.]